MGEVRTGRCETKLLSTSQNSSRSLGSPLGASMGAYTHTTLRSIFLDFKRTAKILSGSISVRVVQVPRGNQLLSIATIRPSFFPPVQSEYHRRYPWSSAAPCPRYIVLCSRTMANPWVLACTKISLMCTVESPLTLKDHSVAGTPVGSSRWFLPAFKAKGCRRNVCDTNELSSTGSLGPWQLATPRRRPAFRAHFHACSPVGAVFASCGRDWPFLARLPWSLGTRALAGLASQQPSDCRSHHSGPVQWCSEVLCSSVVQRAPWQWREGWGFGTPRLYPVVFPTPIGLSQSLIRALQTVHGTLSQPRSNGPSDLDPRR